MGAPRQLEIDDSGRKVGALDWGGNGPALVVLHPNGFCAGMFDPIARRMVDSHRVIGVDLPGHGQSGRPDEDRLLGYDHSAASVIAVLDALGVEEFDLVGVSLGGGVSFEVALQAPDRVRRVMANEAAAFPGLEGDGSNGNMLAVGARRRRQVWADRSTVEESYGSRPPLNALAPEVLAAYVTYGFDEVDDGTVVLACDPDVEANYFEQHAIGYGGERVFARLGELDSDRVEVLCGSETDLQADMFSAQAKALGRDLTVVEGGHFFLFEDVDRAIVLIERSLTEED